MLHRLHKPTRALVAAAFLAGLHGSAASHLAMGAPRAVHADSHASPRGARGTETERPSHRTSHHGDGAPCQCIGMCHGAAAVPVPAPASTSFVAAPVHRYRRPATTTGAAMPRPTLYLLPFANAPPSA